MIEIVSINGNKPISLKIHEILSLVSSRILNSGKLIKDSLKMTVRRHFLTIYPGSSHYDPKKVNDKGYANGLAPSGEVNINVPGVTRAYHDMHISPVKRNHLTIPMHSSAYGKKATEFNDMFPITKKNGKKFLARESSGSLTFMYFLAENVHQSQDNRIMPADLVLSMNIFSRMYAMLRNYR